MFSIFVNILHAGLVVATIIIKMLKTNGMKLFFNTYVTGEVGKVSSFGAGKREDNS